VRSTLNMLGSYIQWFMFFVISQTHYHPRNMHHKVLFKCFFMFLEGFLDQRMIIEMSIAEKVKYVDFVQI